MADMKVTEASQAINSMIKKTEKQAAQAAERQERTTPATPQPTAGEVANDKEPDNDRDDGAGSKLNVSV